MDSILIIAIFTVIGAGLKYIDNAFDEEQFNKKIAIAIVPMLLIAWIYLSFYDNISATIMFAILFAVLLTGKVDNSVFLFSSVVLVLALALIVTLIWLPLIIMVIMGIIDEKGNDYVDTHVTTKIWKFFFMHRFCMKICVFGLCLFSIFPWLYLMAFLAFDLSYEGVACISESR